MMSNLSTLANMIAGRRQRRVKTGEAMPAIYWTCPFSKAKTRETSREGRSNGNQVDAALAGGGSVDCVVCPPPIQVVPSRTGLDTRLM